MNTTIVATGSAMPERRIKNSYFLDRKFLNEDGTPITKPVEEIVAKLEQITGIKERGYISETGDSLPLLTAGAEDAIKNWGKDRNEIDGIIAARLGTV